MRIVFDLDGTLADPSHREHFISGETKDWDGYFAACGEDAPMPAREVLCAMVAAGHTVEIWSGRGVGANGENRITTERWLLEHTDLAVDRRGIRRLRMRMHNDYTPDNELKKRWLEEARRAFIAPELVFDDRQKVVDMWRAEGIPCFQVAPGDF